jgi:hypothetical protein
MKALHALGIAILSTSLSSCVEKENPQAFIYIKEEFQSSLGHPQDKELTGNPQTVKQLKEGLEDGSARFNCVIQSKKIPNIDSGKEITGGNLNVYSTYFLLGGNVFLVKENRIYSDSRTRELDFDMEKLLAEKCSSQT